MDLAGLGLSCDSVPKVDRNRGRLKLFLASAIAAAIAEVGWMSWAARHRFHERLIPGDQENYAAQLRLKSANDPELGFANRKDVVTRPGIPGPRFLILPGVAYSLRRTGGNLLDRYFVNYEMMFLFWPWKFGLRFLYPVAPLAFLWRGARLLWRWARDQPVLTGVFGFGFSVFGGVCSIAWGRHVLRPQLCSSLALPLRRPASGMGSSAILGQLLAGTTSVVMAGKDDMIDHYSERRSVWFPPLRDAATLMQGITRYHVQYVVVAHYGNDFYWRPPAEECFNALSRAYPGAFHRVYTGPYHPVFEVSTPPLPRAI